MLFGMNKLIHVDKVMKFISLKRTALKYRLKLIKRYGVEGENDEMISFD